MIFHILLSFAFLQFYVTEFFFFFLSFKIQGAAVGGVESGCFRILFLCIFLRVLNVYNLFLKNKFKIKIIFKD